LPTTHLIILSYLANKLTHSSSNFTQKLPKLPLITRRNRIIVEDIAVINDRFFDLSMNETVLAVCQDFFGFECWIKLVGSFYSKPRPESKSQRWHIVSNDPLFPEAPRVAI
jgi:hypothetical protein